MSVLYAIGFKFQVWILNIFLIFFPAAQNWKKVLMLNVWFLQKINNEHSTFKLCHNKISWWDAEDTRIKTNFRKAFAPLFNKVVTSHHISLGTYFCSGSQKKKGRKKLEMDCIKNKRTFLWLLSCCWFLEVASSTQSLIGSPSITYGVHRNENFVEIIPLFSTFSNFFKKKKKNI